MAVSIRDIAHAAGVGRTAVSLALRGRVGVSEATRQRVLAVAAELGYRADPLVSRLAERRWRSSEKPVVALIENRRSGLIETARTLRPDFHWDSFGLDEVPGPGRLTEILASRGVEGVLFGRMQDRAFTRYFGFEGFCAVSIEAGTVRMPIHQVRPDVGAGLRLAWARALEAGFRRIGCVYFDEPEARDFIERDGAVRSLQLSQPKDHATCPPLLLPTGNQALQCRRLAAWLKRLKPDCLIVQNAGVYWRVREVGLRLPQDCGLISQMAPVHPGVNFTHCSVSNESRLQSAVWLLERLLRENQRGIPRQRLKVLIEPTWHTGNTFAG